MSSVRSTFGCQETIAVSSTDCVTGEGDCMKSNSLPQGGSVAKTVAPHSQASAEKHTPAPWRIGEEPNHSENSSFGIEGGPLGLVIADVNEDAYSDEEQAANAYLIAAAPELLALVLAHDQHGYCPNCGCDLWNTKGCPTCPLMRQGRDILVKLGMAKPRKYVEWSEPDEINNRNLAKAEK